MKEREIYPWSRTRAVSVAFDDTQWEVVRDGERPRRGSRLAVTAGVLLASALTLLAALSLWLAA